MGVVVYVDVTVCFIVDIIAVEELCCFYGLLSVFLKIFSQGYFVLLLSLEDAAFKNVEVFRLKGGFLLSFEFP